MTQSDRANRQHNYLVILGCTWGCLKGPWPTVKMCKSGCNAHKKAILSNFECKGSTVEHTLAQTRSASGRFFLGSLIYRLKKRDFVMGPDAQKVRCFRAPVSIIKWCLNGSAGGCWLWCLPLKQSIHVRILKGMWCFKKWTLTCEKMEAIAARPSDRFYSFFRVTRSVFEACRLRISDDWGVFKYSETFE